MTFCSSNMQVRTRFCTPARHGRLQLDHEDQLVENVVEGTADGKNNYLSMNYE